MTLKANVPGLIPELYEKDIKEGYFLNNALYEMFGDPKVENETFSVNGGALRWRLETDGTNNAAAVAENAEAVNDNVNSVLRMVVAEQAFSAVATVSFEVVDHGKNEDDPWGREIAKAVKQVKDVAVTTCLATLANAVGTGGAYAGQTRASFANALISGADATAEALSIPAFTTAIAALDAPERAVPRSELAILTGPALASKYATIANQSYTFPRMTMRLQGEGVDGGTGFVFAPGDKYLTAMSYEGIPVYSIPDFPAGTVLIGPLSDVFFGSSVPVPRITPLGLVKRNYRALVDCYAQIAIARPAAFYKMSNKS